MSRQKRPAPTPTALHNNIIGAMRFGAMICDKDLYTVQDIADAMARVQADLASGVVDVEKYVEDCAKGTAWQEVLTAAENEELGGGWKNGTRICGGDLMNAYAYPALVYGIALGMCILEGAPIGKPEDELAEVTR